MGIVTVDQYHIPLVGFEGSAHMLDVHGALHDIHYQKRGKNPV